MESVMDFIPLFVAVMASSGFWAFLSKRKNAKSANQRLLMGLAYDRIIYRGMRHIERGFIYRDEFEDFRKYLIEPYKELGGNGVVDRILSEVTELPIHNHKHKTIHIKTHQGETIHESHTSPVTDHPD